MEETKWWGREKKCLKCRKFQEAGIMEQWFNGRMGKRRTRKAVEKRRA